MSYTTEELQNLGTDALIDKIIVISTELELLKEEYRELCAEYDALYYESEVN